jgi:hypothetical protein
LATPAVTSVIDEIGAVARGSATDEEKCGARHLLCACLNLFGQRPASNVVPDGRADGIRALLLAVHRCRVDAARLPYAARHGEPVAMSAARHDHWLPLSARRSAEAASFIAMSRQWLGALAMDPPRGLGSRPGAKPPDPTPHPAAGARPLIVETYAQMNPGPFLNKVLNEEGWDVGTDGKRTTSVDGGRVSLDVTDMTFELESSAPPDAALGAVVWICFRSCAEALAATLGARPSLNRDIGAISVAGRTDAGTEVRATFDVPDRSWSLEPTAWLE